MPATIFNALITILLVIFHDKVESTLFNAGASWTMAKLLPYILLFSSATVTLLLSLRNFQKKMFGVLFGVIIFSSTIGIDFYFHKIYQGDFSNSSRIIQTENTQIERNTLTVIALPGCEFCHGSIEMLKILKERKPNLNINFLVCSSDSTSLEQYQKPIDSQFNLSLLLDLKTLNKLQINGFPTFIFTDKQGKRFLWTNDSFGAPAKDFIEKNVN